MRYSPLGYWGTATAGCLLAIAGVILVEREMPSGESWAKFLAVSAVMLLAVAVALYAYRSADEIMLGEHKTAWFWGSMASLAAMGPLIVGIAWQLVPAPNLFSVFARLPFLQHIHSAANGMPRISAFQAGFIDGLAFVIFLQLAAFLVLLGWLRLRPAKQ